MITYSPALKHLLSPVQWLILTSDTYFEYNVFVSRGISVCSLVIHGLRALCLQCSQCFPQLSTSLYCLVVDWHVAQGVHPSSHLMRLGMSCSL